LAVNIQKVFTISQPASSSIADSLEYQKLQGKLNKIK
jgi:hypothetical protein